MAGGLFDPSVLYNALKGVSLLPKWNQEYAPDGSAGAYYFDHNTLFAPKPDTKASKNTVAHELTHAVQINMLLPVAQEIQNRLSNKQPVTQEEAAYLDAFTKMLPNMKSGVSRSQRKDSQSALDKALELLYKDKYYDKADNEYRTSPHELQAHGVGNMTQEGKVRGDRYNPHLDPSMASELSILMSMYDKLPATVRDTAIKARQKEINPDPRSIKGASSLRFIDITEDPFKPTIK